MHINVKSIKGSSTQPVYYPLTDSRTAVVSYLCLSSQSQKSGVGSNHANGDVLCYRYESSGDFRSVTYTTHLYDQSLSRMQVVKTKKRNRLGFENDMRLGTCRADSDVASERRH